MTLYCLNKKERNESSLKALKDAAQKRDIQFEEIVFDSYSFKDVEPIQPGNLFYNVSAHHETRVLEWHLLQEGVSTFYKDINASMHEFDNVVQGPLLHAKSGLPVIPTVFHITTDRERLCQYVESLGGFPIVIKAKGGSHGVGVIKIESQESLFSIVDVLLSTSQQYIMRSFIDYASHIRCIVLGDEVIASVEYKRVDGDFRSNVGTDLNVVPINCPEDIAQTSVRAVHLLGFEFGGVDILTTSDGAHYLAETNFPCFFPRTQDVTGIDIAGTMIDFLVDKVKAQK